MKKSYKTNRFQHRVLEYLIDNGMPIRKNALPVLLAIAHFMNAKTLSCFPSLQKLSKTAGVSESTVKRRILEFAASGIITIEHERRELGGTINVYRFRFINADFYEKPIGQIERRSRVNTQDCSNTNTKNSVSVLNTNTNTNGKTESVKDAKPIASQKPKGTDAPTLLPGFRWMRNSKRGENPFDEIFDRTGSCHCQAYFPSENGEPEAFEQSGTPLAPDILTKIKQNPLQAAFEAIGGNPSRVLQLTLRSRLNRLGRKHFTAEVMNFVSILESERTARSQRGRIAEPSKVLVSRMDKTYAQLIAQSGYKDGMWDWSLLWDVAEGRKPMPRFAA